jgi:hypothetical protein
VPPPTDEPTAAETFPRWYHVVCGGLALILVFWGAYMLLWDRVPQVCHEEVTTSEKAATPKDLVVQVCEPMSATDPRVFLFLLMILLLLVPFFSEIEIPGILRVKRDLREAQEDIGTLRTSIGVAQTQLTNIRSSAQATSTTQIHNYYDRSAKTGEGLKDYESADEIVAPNLGAYAQAAFRAALVGLPELLSGWAEGASVVGFTIKQDGTFSDPQIHSGDAPVEITESARNFLNEHPKTVGLAGGFDGRMAITCPARDDDGSIVGGIAVITAQGHLFPREGIEGMKEMFADVQVVARTYARLLVDLLGETSRLANDGTEEVSGR